MFAEYLPILIMMGVAAVICTAMVTLSYVLGPKRNTAYKSSAYECGVAPQGNALERVPIKFYLVAIIFVLFDIEVVFLWSWLTVFANASLEYMVFTGIAMLIYFALWILGDAYVIRSGALDWDEAISLAPEKLQDAFPARSETPAENIKPVEKPNPL